MGPPRLPRATRSPEGRGAVGGERLPGQVAHRAQPPHLGLHRGVGPHESRREGPVRLRRERGREELERGRQELGDHHVARGGREIVAWPARDHGDIGARQGPEPEMHVGDDAEPAEAAHLQLGEVVARHVLDHPPAGAYQPPVAGRDSAAKHVIAHGAEAMTQRAGGAGRHAPSRGFAPAGPADRGRATSLRRRAAAVTPPSACPPGRWPRGRRDSPRAPDRARGCSPRDRPGRRQGARCRVPRPGSSSPRRAPVGTPARARRPSPASRGGARRNRGPLRRCRAARAGGRRRRRSSAGRRRPPLAAGVDRHHLAGIRPLLGIEGQTDRAHGREGIGVEDRAACSRSCPSPHRARR